MPVACANIVASFLLALFFVPYTQGCCKEFMLLLCECVCGCVGGCVCMPQNFDPLMPIKRSHVFQACCVSFYACRVLHTSMHVMNCLSGCLISSRRQFLAAYCQIGCLLCRLTPVLAAAAANFLCTSSAASPKMASNELSSPWAMPQKLANYDACEVMARPACPSENAYAAL